eukprot:c51439_g1_i1 orf=36-188(+)
MVIIDTFMVPPLSQVHRPFKKAQAEHMHCSYQSTEHLPSVNTSQRAFLPK